ncbi:GGDEF domain-containing protein [Sphingomonas sp. Leaf4]|uniref:GGDEF domain-containing protein n=1 Tax=Sphingomonas sp. Leaf4 TaxID=2876553 RepID=UPI001E327C7C|nr:GGDEF domain-containing protein [Sphingomonas sp. Leaf4]
MDRQIESAPDATADGLFQAIGRFLFDQRLEPTPVNYGFAYRVLGDPAGPLAYAVATLTDGGVRLTSDEVLTLGERVEAGDVVGRRISPPDRRLSFHAETERQVAGFESIMQGIVHETHAFGRDLAASEDALRRSRETHPDSDLFLTELARITAQMRERVDVAEARLAQATQEASELRRQLARARDDARRDALTGLPNRRAFEEALAVTTGDSCHLAICDVDHFKAINDRYGHPVGDRVLKAIGATLARACEGHLVARYGGEEFTVLLSDVSADEACALLQAARSAVAARRYRLRENDQLIEGITLSAGIVTLRGDESASDALRRADGYLYAAKQAGRDRTVGEFCQGSVEIT